ncbi:MAG: response regulator transcription factor [Acidobacteria bacterium]|nr:response regulator transcription factor [Acidobacteriota bacterium]
MPPPADTPRCILIVEDHPLVAKFYSLALERAGGFTCVVTEDVTEMLAYVEAGRVDLAILDVSLSGTEWEGHTIDGVELAHLLREHAPSRLPILLATAHAMAGDRERLMAASGADDYMEKPIYDAAHLVEKVRNLLRRNS